MVVEIKKSVDSTVIEIVGRLDTTTAPALEKTINEDIVGTKHLVLDLKRLEYISSAGLRVLLKAQKQMQQLGSMRVKNVSDEIMEIFDMTGFNDILTIDNK